MPPEISPPPVTTPAALTDLLQRAIRRETPCGKGTLVWHLWSPPAVPAPNPLPPVVLLHGGSGSWTHWARNIDALVQAGRRVLVPDLPGFGDSARPAQGRDADALVAPLDEGLALLLDTRYQQVDLVGFSFGGLTAGLWAQALPAQIRQLVLVGAPGLGVASRQTVPLAAWRHLDDPAAVQQVHWQNIAALMLLHEASISPLALWIHTANVLRDRMPGRRLAYTEALKQALPHIHCPVTAIYGFGDALYRGQHPALAAAVQGAPDFRGLHWVHDAGHWAQFERPGEFDALLAQVLHRGGELKTGTVEGKSVSTLL